ncbi:MAG: 3D domain-containing protein [Aerococcaceae bacterium]|nr:3D domain-containing protein [Aerococcaceae bacterium]
MKKTLKLMTVLGATAGLFPSGSVFAQSEPQIFSHAWFSRSIYEVKHSIQQTANHGVYTVQWGDTLSTIAQATGFSVSELALANQIADVDLIIAGTVLYIDATQHTVTYVAPTEAPVTVSTQEAAIVETPAEVEEIVTQAAEVIAAETTPQPVVVETTVTPAETVAAPVVTEVTESVVESVEEAEEVAETTTPETVVEETVENEAPAVESVIAQPEAVSASQDESTSQGTPITVEATAYSYQEAGLTNFTADGTDLTVESKVIAVDPSVIPLGSIVYIPGYGTYRAADTGGAIVGNKIDIHFDDVASALQFGRQTLTIYLIK